MDSLNTDHRQELKKREYWLLFLIWLCSNIVIPGSLAYLVYQAPILETKGLIKIGGVIVTFGAAIYMLRDLPKSLHERFSPLWERDNVNNFLIELLNVHYDSNTVKSLTKHQLDGYITLYTILNIVFLPVVLLVGLIIKDPKSLRNTFLTNVDQH